MAGPARSNDDELMTGINVTPLVDVVLVLLVALMVTATAVAARSMSVDLPKAASGAPAVQRMGVVLHADGRLELDGMPIAKDDLRRRVASARAADAELRVTISADGAASHQSVVALLDLLRLEGVTRYAFDVRAETR
jgi:biopolymer transport protein TolR